MIQAPTSDADQPEPASPVIRVRPGPLPTYAWASTAPDRLVVPLPSQQDWRDGLPPLTATDLTDFPPAPEPQPGDLVPVAHPRIRTLCAYWHEGWPFAVPVAMVRPDVAVRLDSAVDSLPDGFGLAVWDAWRDPRLQAVLHDTVYQNPDLAPGFVALPDPDPTRCPPHASGGTVDLTLTWQQQPLSLGTRFDAFVPEAAATALEPDGPDLLRDLRRLLARAMSGSGFVVHPQEWWHWEYGTRMHSAVTRQAVRYGHTSPPAPYPDNNTGIATPSGPRRNDDH